MRPSLCLALLVALTLIGLVPTPLLAQPIEPASTNTLANLASDCATQASNLSSMGRPLLDTRLIASADPALSSPPIAATTTHTVRPGETLSRIATTYGTTIRAIMDVNYLQNSNLIYSGQQLLIPVAGTNSYAPGTVTRLAAPFYDVWLRGDARQGEAAQLWVRAEPGVIIEGQYGTQEIPFQQDCGLQWGLVAFDVLNDPPGMHTITLHAKYSNGYVTTTTVAVDVLRVNYYQGQAIVYPDDREELLRADRVRGENEYLWSLFASLPNSAPLWSKPFQPPINSVWTQTFGSTGMRDGKPVGYHEGIDYRARYPQPFYAPAAGVVILAEPLTVRGNVIYINHGAGVVTGYCHLSEFNVAVGDTVIAGQPLGLTGNTGLSTAPHLHWELRVNGRWVSPVPFFSISYPE